MADMLDIKKNYPLMRHNTFAIDSIADRFFTIDSSLELVGVLDHINGEPFLVLGGGSNLLLDEPHIHPPVLWINFKGIERVHESGDSVLVRAFAGQDWHEFVSWTIGQGYGGLENLSLIPGRVGAAPVQNIGAYGVELKDVLYQVEAINVNTGTMTTLNNEECAFGYRDSLFKTAQRGQWIILSVTVRLSRKRHQLKLDYGMIRQRLRESGIGEPTIRDVSNAVISIRKERLPDPADLPNAGSFFKNPLVTSDQYESLKIEFPGIPGFEQDDGQVKIPAAWLIEGCQWKGVRRGNVGVHQHHALVLVNYGNATGAQVTELANEIQDSVSQRFGIMLEFEVNLASKATIVRDA